MMSWIKGYLKVLDSVRSAGEVSVSNLGFGHSLLEKKPPLMQLSLKLVSNVRQFKIKNGLRWKV